MAMAVVLAGCSTAATSTTTTTTTTTSTSGAPEPVEIVLMTHDSFAVSDEVLETFEDETGIEVRILRSGDA
ncbi:MAG TPA: thiamine ABC transporter substrate-binding protein, partial [Acidimicrobiia bacterium]|nr:thiamine ABC transporter substrate-binding protein [Acidimicrobiia bacterium]